MIAPGTGVGFTVTVDVRADVTWLVCSIRIGPDVGFSAITVREGVKKKTYLFGTLSQTSDPTHPPRTFGTPLSEK